MSFETYIPADALKPYIRCFIIQETADEKVYRVLPDTGLVIGFQYKGRLAQLDGHQEKLLAISGVSGLADHSKIFKNLKDTGTILVFFKEAGAEPFFKMPVHELFRESVSLDHFMLRSELLLLEEQLAEASSGAARIRQLERFLTDRIKPTEPDRLVLDAIALIHKTRGNIRITELAAQLNTSASPLEKRFRKAVGSSPKKFASVVRFKNTISQYNNASSLTKLGYTSGFYDQAHFIKEFKSFTGETPENFFSGDT